ncbi:putative Nudix hydrolase [Virgisporangium aliadipatigenens]|uniref:Putative Nudix hydrolase n=1 Tax=Virgisporangium aliadipatigenens TaxID=741659 RepID=A0A8J3YH40_9ACTN|nr:NUDIX domain-containing protein [Virgisporangium aliadipatigenens]GIJ45109.1 putative Nudix hydrolase [Virgisporangium aliadipatigenens]
MERVDVVDEHDTVIGAATRDEAYARRLIHRCAVVLVRDAHGRVFVHRRTDTKSIFPGLYDMFVGGVVHAGETYAAAALREAAEELGVTGLPRPEPLFTFLTSDPLHRWWMGVHEVRWDGPVRPQPDEIAWHAFLPEEELRRKLDEWEWVPDGLEAYRRLCG